MVKDTILYDLLGVSPNADEKELKKAYRKMSVKWHPDKNIGNRKKATEKFQEITQAYQILNDPKKRDLYNQIGIDILKKGAEDGMNINPEDFFRDFMGGGFNPFGSFNPFGGRHNKKKDVKEDCETELIVTMEDIFNQVEKTVNYIQRVYCKDCNGYGTSDGTKSNCSDCNGSGQKVKISQMGPMIQQMSVPCDICRGSGENIRKKCSTCNGYKFHNKQRTFTFNLQRELCDGRRIQINEKGHIYRDGKSKLVIFIKERRHNLFNRDGNNLRMSLNIKLFQALFGFKKNIKYLDGSDLCLNLKNISNNLLKTNSYVVKNYGMYNLNGLRGDLIVDVNIKFPKLNKLEKNELDILKKLLIKIDLDDYQKEVKINNKNIVELENYNNEDTTSNEDSSQPHECVSQ
jgi:DnaJ family protein A protein 2